MGIDGKLIHLEEYTRELCHEFYKKYSADPQMTATPYSYSSHKVDKYFEIKVLDPSRVCFAIMLGRIVIGEIQLKRIDYEKRHGTLSIILADDAVKNKGYGTEAEELLLDYAINTLKLGIVFADAVQGNTRSKRVLEKVGFSHREDKNGMSYYSYTPG